MSFINKFLTKEATSLARSVLQSNAKQGIKSLLQKFKTKSSEQIQSEVKNNLGYTSVHYTVNKDQEIIYKPSVVFVREWLSNSPFIKDRIIKDEETGQIFMDGQLINPSKKLDIINEFIKQTNIRVASLNSHFDGAFKLLDVSDFNSKCFTEYFAGWNPNSESVIGNFLPNLYGEALETDVKYASFLFRKWIVGAAKRIIEPGVTFDGCLTLTGPGAVGKTSFFREILPSPFNNRTAEILCSIKNPQKFVEGIVGKSVVCFDELSILDAPKTQETFKQLLSTRFIDVRLPWRKQAERFDLRCTFSATTNKQKFIKDAALSRRLWVIQLNNKSRINFDYFNNVKKQLWQEAIFLASNGESHLLSLDEQNMVIENNKNFLL